MEDSFFRINNVGLSSPVLVRKITSSTKPQFFQQLSCGHESDTVVPVLQASETAMFSGCRQSSGQD
jgi:hypothetical protein